MWPSTFSQATWKVRGRKVYTIFAHRDREKWNWTLECGEPFTKTSPSLPYFGISWFNEALSCKSLSALNSQLPRPKYNRACRMICIMQSWSQSLESSQWHTLYDITPCGATAISAQFGQLDKPCADSMINESASSLKSKTIKESGSSRHFWLAVHILCH